MKIFRRKRITHAVGAGLTYCAGFDLVVRADAPSSRLTIKIDQERCGGTDLHPPRQVASFEVRASPVETVSRVETDEGTLGHPCAEVFRFVVSLEGAAKAELVITDTQTLQEAQVILGDDWTAAYPAFTGPNGVRLEYRPLYGYLD